MVFVFSIRCFTSIAAVLAWLFMTSLVVCAAGANADLAQAIAREHQYGPAVEKAVGGYSFEEAAKEAEGTKNFHSNDGVLTFAIVTHTAGNGFFDPVYVGATVAANMIGAKVLLLGSESPVDDPDSSGEHGSDRDMANGRRRVAGALVARAASPAHIQALLAPLRALAVLSILAVSAEAIFELLSRLMARAS